MSSSNESVISFSHAPDPSGDFEQTYWHANATGNTTIIATDFLGGGASVAINVTLQSQ